MNNSIYISIVNGKIYSASTFMDVPTIHENYSLLYAFGQMDFIISDSENNFGKLIKRNFIKSKPTDDIIDPTNRELEIEIRKLR